MIPFFIHQELGFGNTAIGMAIGIQFLAAVLIHGYVGRPTNQYGAKRPVLQGMLAYALAGATRSVVALLPLPVFARLGPLLLGRLILGSGENRLPTGSLSWGIGLVGPARSDKVMPWNGMAIYGSLAADAPPGPLTCSHLDVTVLAYVITGLPLVAWLINGTVRKVTAHGSERSSLWSVTDMIWWPDIGLGL